jgi:hypothetical protein
MMPPLSDARIACRKNFNGKIFGRFFQNFLRRDYNKSYTQSQRKKKPQSRFLRQERGFEGTRNAETQNRTADTAVFSRMLYQLSYLGVSVFILCGFG